MRTVIYYFIHLTGQDRGNTGIQRVTRNLGRALQDLPTCEVVPVRWCDQHDALVHAEEEFREIIKLHGGPQFGRRPDEGRPVHLSTPSLEGAWLLLPEVPHLQGESARYRSAAAPQLFGYARARGLKVATIFHDLLPLTDRIRGSGTESERLKFTIYGQALQNVDLVLPVSQSSATKLEAWLDRCGAGGSLPSIQPILLPEEMVGIQKGACRAEAPLENAVRFVTYGTVCKRKNQLHVMEAFNRLRQRRPELAMKLHVVGHVHPEVALGVSRAVKQSMGSIELLGYRSDEELMRLISEARATVFVSLAEGYGLPVAESLWLGRPCITSNIAPMTELASSGGCLTVSPFDRDEIEDALAAIATDRAIFDRLTKEIEGRKLKTWREYAMDIVSRLNAPDVAEKHAARATRIELLRHEPVEHVVPIETMQFTLDDMTSHAAYKTSSPPLIEGGVFRFSSSAHGHNPEPVLLHGPYAALNPGRYRLSLSGELVGSLVVRLTVKSGKKKLVERVMTNELQRIDFHVEDGETQDFELVAVRQDTEMLRLRRVYLERTS